MIYARLKVFIYKGTLYCLYLKFIKVQYKHVSEKSRQHEYYIKGFQNSKRSILSTFQEVSIIHNSTVLYVLKRSILCTFL